LKEQVSPTKYAFSGFYKKSIEDRLEVLSSKFNLTSDEISTLKNCGALNLDVADRMIENVVGVVHLPVGVATNFKINGKDFIVPMAIEEPSVIAAASNAAKLSLPIGFISSADDSIMTGQIQIISIDDVNGAFDKINKNKSTLLSSAREFAKGMEKYGGGVVGLNPRKVGDDSTNFLVVEVYINVMDAMGANTVNTVMEGLAPYLINLIGGKVRLRILTNLSMKRRVVSSAIWKKEDLGEQTINGIIDAYNFARLDVFRCATNNKGIMNGIDAVALATGNDWRAVEAGAHSFASLKGVYSPLAIYEKTKDGDLVGRIELPLAVGIVGGSIKTKPTPKILLKIMNVSSSKELAMVMASVGLANNFAALKALSTEGINKGHMKLHARNIAVLAGAKSKDEVDILSAILIKFNNYSLDFAKSKVKEMKK